MLSILATEDMAGKTYTNIKLSARDDSGRLDSAVQANNPNLCCRSTDMTSLINVSFTLNVANATQPAILFPTPVNNSRILAMVNCPMPAIAIFGYHPTSFNLVPDGCVPGSVMKGEPRQCTAASPADCTCNPSWPQGAFMTAATSFSWRPWRAAAGSSASPWYWLRETYTARFDGVATTVTVVLTANRDIPAGSVLSVTRLAGVPAGLNGPVTVNFSACGGYPNASLTAALAAAAGSVRMQVASATPLVNMSFRIAGNVSCQACAAVLDPPPDIAPWYWVNASFTLVPPAPGAGPAANARLSVCLLANGMLPPATALVLRGMSGLLPGAGPVLATVLSNSTSYAATAQADAAAGTLALTLGSGGMAVCLTLDVAGNASMARAAAEAISAAVDQTLFAPVDIAPTRLSAAANCGPGALSGTAAQLAVEANRLGRQHLIRWTPGPADAGRTYRVCFRAVTAAARSTAQRCVIIEVQRCMHCVVAGEGWAGIAALYSTKWLQLWAANAASPPSPPPYLPAVQLDGTHPDRIAAGAVVRLGPVYTVATMTHYAHLAKQLGVAEAAILAANRDVEAQGGWAMAGQGVCVLPLVCDSELNLDGSV